MLVVRNNRLGGYVGSKAGNSAGNIKMGIAWVFERSLRITVSSVCGSENGNSAGV